MNSRYAWVITHGSYEEETIEYVFTDGNLALEAHEKLRESSYYWNSPKKYRIIESINEVLEDV